MTTPHIGNEDGIVTADQADDETEQPEQAAQANNTAPPDPAAEAEPDEAEPDEVPREMERSLPAPTAFNIDAIDLYSEWEHWSSENCAECGNGSTRSAIAVSRQQRK